MKNLSMMNSVELFAYRDVTSSVIDSLVAAGNHLITVQAYGGLKMDESQKSLDSIRRHLDTYSDKRNMISEEISSRVKKNLGLEKGPIDIDKLIGNLAKKYPVLNRPLDELKREYEVKKSEGEVKKAKLKVSK